MKVKSTKTDLALPERFVNHFCCPNFDSGRQIALSHRRYPLLSCAVEPADSGDPRRLGVLSALEVILVDEDEPDVHVGAQLALAVTACGGEGARGFRQFFVVFQSSTSQNTQPFYPCFFTKHFNT